MTNKSKYIIIAIVGILLIAIIIIFSVNFKVNKDKENNTENMEENVVGDYPAELNIETEKEEVPEKFLKERKYEKVKIKNIDILAIAGTVTFKAEIENISNEILENKGLIITFKDNEGKELRSIDYTIEKLEPNKTMNIDFVIGADISSISDYTITVKDNV